MLTILMPSRVHITLVDLGKTGYRRGRGIGFAIDHPRSKLEFSFSPNVDLQALLEVNYTSAEVARLEETLLFMQKKWGAAGLTLLKASIPSRHAGFGTGTAVALACVEAFSILNKLDLSQPELISASGRGGTSGVGINTYFDGGFIFDVGHRDVGQKIMSSDSVVTPKGVPFRLIRLDMPSWDIGLAEMPGNAGTDLSLEKSLFESILPLEDPEVYAAAYHSVFGVTAAVADNDLERFCAAVNRLQEGAWKKNEIALHDPGVRELMRKLSDLGALGVGLSSVGPAVYFLAQDFSSVYCRIKAALPNVKVEKFKPANMGRILLND